MAGNYLHTLPKKYEPIESNLQEASVSLADILKSQEVSKWSLNINVGEQVISINFPLQDDKEQILSQLTGVRRRLESAYLYFPQVRVNIAMASNGAVSKSDIAAFPGRLTPVAEQSTPYFIPKIWRFFPFI